MNVTVRAAQPGDAERLSQFAAAQPFASNDFLVVVCGDDVAAFLAWRNTGPDESEILHLETAFAYRRRGFARLLLRRLQQVGCSLFLEVRPSNFAACQLYEHEGFTRIGVRKDYYSSPSEEAIVLKFHSC